MAILPCDGVSERWMRIEILNFVSLGSSSLWSWTELSLDESADLTAVHASGRKFVSVRASVCVCARVCVCVCALATF